MSSPTAVKDSGAREDFTTGSVRDSRVGKGRYDLLPEFAIDAIAKHMETGALRYGDRNWEKGQPNSRFLDSAQRHISCYKRGMRDENHLAAAAWNIMCIIDQQGRIAAGALDSMLDDIYNPLEMLDIATGPLMVSGSPTEAQYCGASEPGTLIALACESVCDCLDDVDPNGCAISSACDAHGILRGLTCGDSECHRALLDAIEAYGR